MHASSIFRLPLSIQSTVCSQGQEPRVSDGKQDSKCVPPFMQCELLCKTTQYLKSRNRQSHGWQTNRLIPKHGRILFRWVFLRLKIRIEDKFLPCLFLFGPFLYLCCGDNPCLRLCLGGKGEIHPSDSHHCLLTSLSFLCFLWTTKQSPLLTKFRDLVLVLRQGMLFRFFRIYLCAFLFPFLFFFSAGGPYMGLPDTLSVVPCPETWSFIINVTLLASHFILGPLSKVVFSIVFHDGGSVHATDVSAHAEWRILHRAFRLTK